MTQLPDAPAQSGFAVSEVIVVRPLTPLGATVGSVVRLVVIMLMESSRIISDYYDYNYDYDCQR